MLDIQGRREGGSGGVQEPPLEIFSIELASQELLYSFLLPVLYNNQTTCNICDRACENRACGLKYTMSFDETYLNTEM